MHQAEEDACFACFELTQRREKFVVIMVLGNWHVEVVDGSVQNSDGSIRHPHTRCKVQRFQQVSVAERDGPVHPSLPTSLRHQQPLELL